MKAHFTMAMAVPGKERVKLTITILQGKKGVKIKECQTSNNVKDIF